MVSLVRWKVGGDGFDAEQADGARDGVSRGLLGELVGEIIMAAFVVLSACALMAAAIAVAYCSGKAAVCRELLWGAVLTLH